MVLVLRDSIENRSMTKFIVNNCTDALKTDIFFTITSLSNCPLSLIHVSVRLINKFLQLYIVEKSFCVHVYKIVIYVNTTRYLV